MIKITKKTCIGWYCALLRGILLYFIILCITCLWTAHLMHGVSENKLFFKIIFTINPLLSHFQNLYIILENKT